MFHTHSNLFPSSHDTRAQWVEPVCLISLPGARFQEVHKVQLNLFNGTASILWNGKQIFKALFQCIYWRNIEHAIISFTYVNNRVIFRHKHWNASNPQYPLWYHCQLLDCFDSYLSRIQIMQRGQSLLRR